MGFREDQTKILEMICAQLAPSEIVDYAQKVSLNEKDFEREGFSFNSALLLVKDLYETDFISKFEHTSSKDDTKGILMEINPGFDKFTIQYKYPEIENKETPIKKISIIIDSKKGIYREDKQGQSYELKNPSKRLSLIYIISQKDKIMISEIEEEVKQSTTLILKEIKAINKNFKTKLSVVDDLIIHIPTGGYSLNKDSFYIKLSS